MSLTIDIFTVVYKFMRNGDKLVRTCRDLYNYHAKAAKHVYSFKLINQLANAKFIERDNYRFLDKYMIVGINLCIANAIKHNNLPLTRYLLDRERAYGIDADYSSYITAAVNAGNINVLKLLSSRADCKYEFSNIVPNLAYEVVEFVLNHFNVDLDAALLNIAHNSQSAEILDLMLSHGANFNCFGEIIPNRILSEPNADAVKVLINHGLDVAWQPYANTAANNGNCVILDMLSPPRPSDSLGFAVRRGHVSCVNLILTKYKISKHDIAFMMSFATAITPQRKQLSIVKLLADHGAYLDCALRCALKYHNHDVINFLLDRGAFAEELRVSATTDYDVAGACDKERIAVAATLLIIGAAMPQTIMLLISRGANLRVAMMIETNPRVLSMLRLCMYHHKK